MNAATPEPSMPNDGGEGVRARLRAAGLELPTAAGASYHYEPVVVWGDVAFVSGQIPKRDGAVAWTGHVGGDRSIDDGVAAAELCALNALAQLDAELGLDRVARILKLNAYVASAPGFTKQPLVAEGASELLLTALGDAGRHARTALGAPDLPARALVEIELVVGLKPAGAATDLAPRHGAQ